MKMTKRYKESWCVCENLAVWMGAARYWGMSGSLYALMSPMSSGMTPDGKTLAAESGEIAGTR